MLGGGVDAATLWPRYAAARRPPCAAGAVLQSTDMHMCIFLYTYMYLCRGRDSGGLEVHREVVSGPVGDDNK